MNSQTVRCTCQLGDVTSIGDTGRRVMTVMDPECEVHGEPAPVGVCAACGSERGIAELRWTEHDPRRFGWWCNDCMRSIGAAFASPDLDADRLRVRLLNSSLITPQLFHATVTS